ncbi:hypothetical protein DHD08_01570 [Arenibacter sp. H213]|nr:hypothetical protein [Arenibacter sp. H213]
MEGLAVFWLNLENDKLLALKCGMHKSKLEVRKIFWVDPTSNYRNNILNARLVPMLFRIFILWKGNYIS